MREGNRDENGYEMVKAAFDSTSRFARLESIKTKVVGRHVYIRYELQSLFVAPTEVYVVGSRVKQAMLWE